MAGQGQGQGHDQQANAPAGLDDASSVSRVLKHIAVLCFPFASHHNNLFSLARCLAARSSPTTAFSFFGTAKSNAAIFPAGSNPNDYNNIRPFNVHDGLLEGYTRKMKQQNVVVHLEEVDLFLKAAPEGFRQALERAEEVVGSPVTCVVSDAMLWMVADLAEAKGIPWVAFHAGGPRSVLAHIETDTIYSTVGDGIGDEDKFVDFIPGFENTKCRELPDILYVSRDSIFARLVYKMGQSLPRAMAVACNGFEEADPVVNDCLRSKLKEFLNIGLPSLMSPPNQSDPDACIPWLDRHEKNSVVYVSFGTVGKLKPDELKGLLEGLLDAKYPFLFSFRGNLTEEEDMPREIVEKVMIAGKVVPWAPQLAILNHPSVGVFVTHCGWTSFVESVMSGVPMIVRPGFGDQPLYRVMIEDEWKIGASPEGGAFTKEGMVKALELIMSKEEGKRMRERVGVWKDVAFKSMEPNGASTRNFETLVEIINN